MTKCILLLALLASASIASTFASTTASQAQSQRNYGPNPPGGYDTYGEPYSGSAASRRQSGGY
ncbi:MAG: hypothetical protein ABSE22_21710 [Xanthobacteraceae bacterium]|jgi:hypothetical protein